MKTSLTTLLSSMTYSLLGVVKFQIHADTTKKVWHLWGSNFCAGPIKLMSGKEIPDKYNTLENAQSALQKVIDDYDAPLTAKEIKSHFNLKWARKEEEADLLLTFRNSLLSGDLNTATKTYNEMSSWTKEAIPSKVIYQLVRNAENPIN
jgi:hypothetical protein